MKLLRFNLLSQTKKLPTLLASLWIFCRAFFGTGKLLSVSGRSLSKIERIAGPSSSMAGHDDEELRMAFRMSMQEQKTPEPKRSKPWEKGGGASAAGLDEKSLEEENRRLKRDLMAAAAEKRMMLAARKSLAPSLSPLKGEESAGLRNEVVAEKKSVALIVDHVVEKKGDVGVGKVALTSEGKDVNLGEQLPMEKANQLFTMVFGESVSKGILAQWTNQGIRFSSDQETSMGLVQHEGGPCGVLAAIQAFVLKYLLFCPYQLAKDVASQRLALTRMQREENLASNCFASLTEDEKTRALVKSIGEILFLCGSQSRAVIATLSVVGNLAGSSDDNQNDEMIAQSLDGLAFESAADFQKYLRITICASRATTLHRLESMIPVFRSRMGAMLFLISALLSRGLDSIQDDRDDPSLPLVTAPFGHASQEIVNLLLCGQAVPNVFDGRMDLGGGMFLKGVSSTVEVGFLTLLESLNFCKVGQNLKRPKWPIWVVGSESHYTVIFATNTNVQEENELESRESQIRKAFDAQDQSGGGGFVSVEGFQQVLRETGINLPSEKVDHLCGAGFIVWSDFWQVLLDLDKSLGGLKDPTGSMGKKVFDLYHFNGIAKSVSNGSQTSSSGEVPVQRPRLTKLSVSVPPKWTPEEFMAVGCSTKDVTEVSKPEPSQHAPLVDCIRTRWLRAVCNWVGDPPSIV
uniref:ubiquitinyl hydrolase 1 n=2 Tax=Kalanchoe fedtschenkoi TaxID=63787 RepID=A0A7N0UAD3_KALFE